MVANTVQATNVFFFTVAGIVASIHYGRALKFLWCILDILSMQCLDITGDSIRIVQVCTYVM